MTLATGETGFIGSNFELQCCAQLREEALYLDASTYASNVANLQSLEDEPIEHYEKLITYAPDCAAHDLHYANAARRIERELRTPADTFKTSICKTVQWYLNNQGWAAQQYGTGQQ